MPSSDPVHVVRAYLARNRLFINDEQAAVRAQDLINKATSILKGFRRSAFTTTKAHEVKQTIEEYSALDELTLLVNLWAILLIKTRHVPEHPIESMTAEEKESAVDWIQRAWKADAVDVNWSSPFAKDSIPPLSRTGDPVLDRLLEHAPKVPNPKPDLTYGIRKYGWSEREQEINEYCAAGLTNGLWHEFFVVEAKSIGKPIGEAENQCCRAGSALVYCRRNFNAMASASTSTKKSSAPKEHNTPQVGSNLPGRSERLESSPTPNPPDKAGEFHYSAAFQPSNISSDTSPSVPVQTYPRIDTTSFAFSLALDPHLAILSVHWAEEKSKDLVHWHMKDLDSYNLRKLDELGNLHHDIDNVLDWGCGKRKREIQETCMDIATLVPRKKKRKTEETE